MGLATTSALAAGPPEIGPGGEFTSPTAKPSEELRFEAAINPNEEPTKCDFQYGETAAYGHEAACTEPGETAEGTEQRAAVTVTGLKPGTTYHYRVVLKNTSGKAEGPDAEVATAPEPPEEPKTIEPAKSITGTSAIFEGVLNPHSDALVGGYFAFSEPDGLTCAEGPTAPLEGFEGEQVVTAKGVQATVPLQPDRKYKFCLVAYNEGGAQATPGSEVSVETPALPPTVANEGAGANSTEATLYATVNPNNEETKYFFEYSTTGTAGVGGSITGTIVKDPSTPGILPSAYEEHQLEIPTGAVLEAGKTYYYRVVAANKQSEKEPHPAEGEVKSFTTDSTPSTDPVTAIGANTATFNGHLAPLNANTATQYHFVYELGSACNGAGASSTASVEAGKGTGSAAATTPATGLQPDRLYSVCLVTSNQFGSQVGPPVSFRTLPETYVTDVASSSATLHAVLDPEGGASSYRFQYGTSAAYGSETAEESVEASGSVTVEAHVQELSPGAVYHFRVIATDAAHETIDSADATFTTLPPAAATTGSFALADDRQYELVSPPDKHGALVEPIGEEGVIEAAAEGGAFTYITSAPTESQPQGNFNESQILATRGPDGWSDKDIATRTETAPGIPLGDGQEYQLFSSDLSWALFESRFHVTSKGFTTFPGEETSPQATEETPYLREDFSCPSVTCYTPLLTTTDVTSGIKYGQGANLEGDNEPQDQFSLRGATPDLSHTVLSVEAPLTKATPTAPEAPGGGLYEWSADKSPAEQLQLVSVLPQAEGGGAAGGYAFGTTTEGHHEETRNAISSDGSRIVWTGNHSSFGPLYMRDTATEETVRLDTVQGGSGKVPERTGVEAEPEANFDIASTDGSRVFFTDTQELTPGSRAGDLENSFREPDLYVCRMVEVEEAGHMKLKCDLTDLTPDANPGEEAAAVQGAVLAASEDGSYVYFVADGVLGDGAERGATTGNCVDGRQRGEPGEVCNLYVEHYDSASEKWEAPRFIAALSGADYPDWSFGFLSKHTSGASPDGSYLAFMSKRDLTGYDTDDVNPGAYEEEDEGTRIVYKEGEPVPAHDEEVYLYDATTGKLVCASCNPTGARPDGERYFGPIEGDEESGSENMRLVGGYSVWPEERWLVANIPGWVPYDNGGADHQPRYLSNSGRLFFNSHDALVPQDVNGQWDVYQYEPPGDGGEGEGSCTTATDGPGDVYNPNAEGCVGLISSGESTEESAFLDASESGGDVFFMTLSQLVGQDVDHSIDVYDAHECTSAAPCFPPSAETPPPCTTEASCKPSPEPPPSIYGAPASATFNGPGNLAPQVAPPPKKVVKKTVKCKKPKKLSHGKCGKPKKKTKGKKSAKGRK